MSKSNPIVIDDNSSSDDPEFDTSANYIRLASKGVSKAKNKMKNVLKGKSFTSFNNLSVLCRLQFMYETGKISYEKYEKAIKYVTLHERNSRLVHYIHDSLNAKYDVEMRKIRKSRDEIESFHDINAHNRMTNIIDDFIEGDNDDFSQDVYDDINRKYEIFNYMLNDI